MSELPVVIHDHYSLLRWLVQRTAKYPRDLKFTLGDRTLNVAMDVLERLLEAAYAKAKQAPLGDANLGLDKLRFLVRLAKDEHCISLKQYEFASRSINEVGKQIGGWRKQAGA